MTHISICHKRLVSYDESKEIQCTKEPDRLNSLSNGLQNTVNINLTDHPSLHKSIAVITFILLHWIISNKLRIK